VDGIDVLKTDLCKYDVIHLTRFNPFTISVPFKRPTGKKLILTIYDLIPLIYPKHYPTGIRGWINWQLNKYLIRKNVDEIITISETSKKDICRFIGTKPEKVHVVYLAPRPIFKKLKIGHWQTETKNRYNLPDHFVLYVGDINYNKNIPLLVKACEMAKVPLVICGKQAQEIESMNLNHPELMHLKNINWSGVSRLGFVPDDDLVKIYNLAEVYVQPSLYEGFGLPVLEANAVGLPVVCSKTQALVEVAEDAALFASINDPKDFADKIKLLISDDTLRRELIEKGFKNAEKYSWEKTARETEKIYK
jgi:glycosyltransferase involved in cell wall biosynthesis